MEHHCPDLGEADPAPDGAKLDHIGAGAMRLHGRRGVEFPGCPVWWLRRPRDFPGRAYGIGGETAYAWAVLARRNLSQGGVGPADELPGRLSDLMLHLDARESLREQARWEARDLERRNQQAREALAAG